MSQRTLPQKRRKAEKRRERELAARLKRSQQPIQYGDESESSDDTLREPTPAQREIPLPWRARVDQHGNVTGSEPSTPESVVWESSAAGEARASSSASSEDGLEESADEESRARKALKLQREVQERLLRGLREADVRGETRTPTFSAHGVHRNATEENPDVQLHDHYIRQHHRKPPSGGAVPERVAVQDGASDGEDMPVLFEKLDELGLEDGGYVSTSSSSSEASQSPRSRDREEAAFARYNESQVCLGGARGLQFDWLRTVGCGMFPNMPEAIVRMLLTLPSVRKFAMSWMGFLHLADKLVYARTLAEWHFMIREMGAFVYHEWYNESHREYRFTVTFRDFENGEMAELKEARKKRKSATIRAADFAAYASDFLQAHILFKVRSNKMHALCVKAEADRAHAKRQQTEDMAQEATRFETIPRDGANQTHSFSTGDSLHVEQDMTDLERLDEIERKEEEQLNKRKQNEIFIEVERLRERGSHIKLPLQTVYLVLV